MAIFQPILAQKFEAPIRSGQVLFLDAGDRRSYPGSGNTWFDLSGNGNNADASLIVAAGYYNSALQGYFDFPGTDYTRIATVPNSNSLQFMGGDFTIEFWGTIDATGTGFADTTGPFAKDDWFDNPGFGILINRLTSGGELGRMNFYVNNTSNFSSASGRIVEPFATNSWFCIQIVRRGGSLTNYSNLRSLQTYTGGGSANMNNSTQLVIGRARNDASANYRWDGKLSVINFYNRALTMDEMKANYNYFAPRYGLRQQ
jgi:hypothetical protein